ncbi:MAG: pyridoxine 5'-phosphate synthase [Albidovulum sp.]|nr:pyridoxine 5'-phosphate synthase [Albidovulum sp.]
MNESKSPGNLRLGVNIDHVATVRNARGSSYPDPLRAALVAESAGADGITAHLREDRRHISDGDIEKLMSELSLQLNLEMAATAEMQEIALRFKPHAVCVVPERREERTTESGLDAISHEEHLKEITRPISEQGSRVSLFIDADPLQVDAAVRIGAAVVEFHTGAYCDYYFEKRRSECERELNRIREAAAYANALGLEVHAGHGLTFETVAPIAKIPQVAELNIGHFLIGEAIFLGLESAILNMKKLMVEARKK